MIRSRKIKWAVYAVGTGEVTRAGFGLKTCRKRPFRRYRCRSGCNIKIDLKETGW
jgi:hypothetical protein